MVWSEQAILDEALPFLHQKNETLKFHKKIVEIGLDSLAQGKPASEQKAIDKYCELAKRFEKEIRGLNNQVIAFIDLEDQSENTQQLLKIHAASQSALNYLICVNKHNTYLLNNETNIKTASFSIALITLSIFGSPIVFGFFGPYVNHNYPYLEAGITALGLSTLAALAHNFEYEQNREKIEQMHAIFEKALHPEITSLRISA
jgi:hypothetical protein